MDPKMSKYKHIDSRNPSVLGPFPSWHYWLPDKTSDSDLRDKSGEKEEKRKMHYLMSEQTT